MVLKVVEKEGKHEYTFEVKTIVTIGLTTTGTEKTKKRTEKDL